MRNAPPLLAIDLLRFACALTVMAFHLTTVFPLSDAATIRLFDPAIVLPTGLTRYSWCGWVGVEVFFVISGFVIALSADGADRMAFARRRVLRLVPAMWIAASVAALVLLAGDAMPVGQVAARWLDAMLFMPVPAPLDPSYWTLSVEIVFYAAVAVLLRGSGNAPRIERAGILLGMASSTTWVLVAIRGMSADVLLASFAWPLTLLPHGVFFALGIMLARLRGGASVPLLCWTALFAGGGALEVALHARTMRGVAGLTTDPTVAVAAFAVAVAIIAAADRLQPAIRRKIGVRMATLLGRLTYPLYLVHQTVAAAVIVVGIRFGLSGAAATALAACCVLLLAWLIAERGEPAVRRALTIWFKRRRGPASDTPRSAFPPAG